MAITKPEIEQRLKQLVGNPLFEAARTDDVNLMRQALQAGRSLADTRPQNGFTPLHTAALCGSSRFLKEALHHRSADPWLRDDKGLLPIDHAEVRRDRTSMQLLFDAMYPDGRVPFPE